MSAGFYNLAVSDLREKEKFNGTMGTKA
jgi:hypothetical protein